MHFNRNLLFGIILGALIAGTVTYLGMAFICNQWYDAQLLVKQKQIAQQAELIESTRQSGLVTLMSTMLDNMDDELNQNPKRTLSDETIGRIVALSYFFKPYLHNENDSIAEHKLSRERGQLLLLLIRMNIDSVTFNRIINKTSFAGADLRAANLEGANLSGAHLNGADLKDAHMQGVNLEKAELRSANLWGADLSKAALNGADLKTTDMRWANLNGATLRSTDMNGADLASAQLRQADLRGADLHYVDFQGAFLTEANLDSANMASTDMKRAQLDGAILIKADLTSSHLNEANLRGANLSGAILTGASMTGADLSEASLKGVTITDKNWLDMLDDWHVKWATELQHRYRVLDQSTSQQPKYFLAKTQE